MRNSSRHHTGATLAALAVSALFCGAAARAQQAAPPALTVPRPSPNASVSQMVGITTVTVHYSRPGVKGRVIWGKLVPYGQVWRAGANENTTIEFSTPVRIEGKELPAGLYGFQAIPSAESWTLIFSKDNDLWGAFKYDQAHDALRVPVKPQAADFQEWMSYDFSALTDSSVEVSLRWEKLRVPFRLEVDTTGLVKAEAEKARTWQPLLQAANYCVQNNVCLDDASRWLDSSIALEANFANQRAKAALLAKRGHWKDAVTYGERALAAGRAAKQPPPAAQVKELEGQIAEWKQK